jgi:hypothetical protein
VLIGLDRGTAAAQTPDLFFVPGRNVNTLGPAPAGPNPALAGNPKHKQRNEDSCDVSPQNPWVVLCANNDYRGIELFGDSWIGLSMSTDGARTWRDRLLNGFPSAPAGIGAADPVVRTVPGLGLVSYITLSRTDGRGTLALALLHERNQENGEPYQFFETRLIGNGTPGRFNDKPAMLAVLDPAGGSITVGGRTIPKGTVHFSYSLFPGNDNNSASQIYHTYSRDYGLSWSSPQKLSESLGINQGVDLAVDDATNTIVATWRQVADTNQADSIVVARSDDGGQTWGKAKIVWTAPAGRFFDQDTSAVQFRTRSMPSVVHDGAAFHAFWSARGFAANPDDARIVVSSSRDGRTWSNPVAVAAYAGRGHQIIPQAAVAGGRIQVDWIDTRNNEPGTFGRNIADFRADAAGNPVPLSAPSPPAGTEHFIYRQSGDIFAAQASVAGAAGSPALAFSGAQSISRYRFGLVNGARRQLEFNFLNPRIFQKGAVAFNGDYHAVAGQRYRPSETTPGAWTRNTAPSTSHALFYSAFTDNRDIQGYVWAGPPATAFTPTGVTQQGENGVEVFGSCSASPETSRDETVWTAGDSPRSRYQNIYAAATLPGLIVASPSGSKPTGSLERAYVVFVQNLTSLDRRYQLVVANQPDDGPPNGAGRASFRPDNAVVSDAGCAPGTDCRTISITIPRGSSTTRTVYLRSSRLRPRILINVSEIGGVQTGSVLLNANPSVAEIENPDSLEALPDILSTENYQPDVLSRQVTFYSTGVVNPDLTPVTDVTNPRIEYPRIEYPRIEYPRIEYPRIEYPRIEYDAVGTPRIEYPRIEYPRIEYSSIQNPRIEYSPLAGDDAGVTPVTQVADVTWPVTTGTGANTITGMSSEVFVNGALPVCSATVVQNCLQGAQLLVSIPQFYTVTRSCGGEQATVVENQVIVNNIVDPSSLRPSADGPDTVNPGAAQPTFFVGPKQVVFLTLRLVGRFDAQFASLLAGRAGVIVRSQPDTSAIDQSNDDQDGTIDITPPVLNLGDVGYLARVEGNTPGGATVNLVVTATDDSGAASVSCVRTGPSGSEPLAADGTATFVPLGSWSATCTAVDSAGNETSRQFPIAVVDSKPPTLDVSGLTGTIVLTPTSGGAFISYSPAAATATDLVDPTLTVTCTPPVGAKLPLGTSSVQCSAADDSGNVATATFTFTVTDTVPPILTMPAPIAAPATSAAGALVTFAAAATDVVDPNPAIVCAPPSGTVFAVGVTTVSCTATDGSGNTSTATFTVTVSRLATTTTVSAANAIYDRLPHGATANVAGSGLSEPVAVTYTGAIGTVFGPSLAPPTSAGTYDASATYAGSASYLGSTGTARFTIARRPASVTPAAKSKAFATADPPLTGTLAGFVAADGVIATYSRTTGEAVGTYLISASLAPAAVLGNYAVTFNTAPFTIVMPPAPSLTATATPATLLWSPNKTMVPVTVTGSALGSGVTIAYSVKDEYKKVQPSGTAVVDANGRYAFVVSLEAYRNGGDADGRFYTITVTATDVFGRAASTTTVVRVPHDQQ